MESIGFEVQECQNKADKGVGCQVNYRSGVKDEVLRW